MLARNLKIHPSIRKSLSLVHVLRYFSSAYILTVSFSTIYCSSILLSHNSEQPQYVSIIVQQDATLYSLFTSANCSTCFGWYIHRSSGAHIIVSTVSGIIETVTATCRECDCSRPVTFTTGSSTGLNNARYCRYSDMSS